MTLDFAKCAAKAAIISLSLGTLAAGCESMGQQRDASVTSNSAGYKALQSGDYAEARNQFEPDLVKAPHDAYLELDLAVADQQLGRTVAAEKLDREAMANGHDVVPPYDMFGRDQGKSIADIACENIALAHNTSSC